MMTFDDVFPTLVRVMEGLPNFDSLRKCAVIRDLRGIVRIIIDPDPSKADFDKTSAEQALKSQLEGYFVAPIWSTLDGGPDEKRLASALLARATRWSPQFRDLTTGEFKTAQPSWHKYERRLSKNAWLDSPDRGTTSFPWPLEHGPCITAFYSFKGGIGRTTALASCAWQLAEKHKKVVILDLDLEAPGIGTLLGAAPKRGLLDLLVDHIATGKVDLQGAYAPARALGAVGDRVLVLPAGRLDDNFVEKLARLDFSSHGGVDGPAGGGSESPVEHALRAILKKVHQELDPDHIFLDARSGIHDLSGLSLHRLAHTDILLARAGEQSYQGFELTLRSLIRRKGHEELQCQVVHSMAAPGDLRDAQDEQEEFRHRSYSAFDTELYSKPNGKRRTLDDVGAPHQPVIIPFDQRLLRFGNIESQRHSLMHEGYRELCERITMLATPSRESNEDGR